MKRILALSLFVWSFHATPAELIGAGSSSVNNMMNDFIERYNKIGPDHVKYFGGGPKDGLKKIKEWKVDFAISVVPILPYELKRSHLMQFPIMVLGFVVVVNVPGLHSGDLVLNGDILAAIFRGKITYWDDDDIQKINLKLALPHLPIVVVHRSDLAGSTFTLTNYLSKVNLRWLLFMGDGFDVDWPVGVSASGNDGMAKKVSSLPGAIGYVELSTARHYGLSYVDMFNRSRVRISPSSVALQSAVDNVDFRHAEKFYVFFTNQGGIKSWPLLAGSYVLLRTDSVSPNTRAVLRFFQWCLTHSQGTAQKMDAIVLPPDVIARINQSWLKEFNWQSTSIK